MAQIGDDCSQGVRRPEKEGLWSRGSKVVILCGSIAPRSINRT
jgi:hypothetical protein